MDDVIQRLGVSDRRVSDEAKETFRLMKLKVQHKTLGKVLPEFMKSFLTLMIARPSLADHGLR